MPGQGKALPRFFIAGHRIEQGGPDQIGATFSGVKDMREKRSRGSHAGASAETEEIMIECRLFNDLITERLCILRKTELSAAWKCSCHHAKRAESGASAANPGKYNLIGDILKQKGRQRPHGTG
jgi:hypothetical protein